MAFDVFHNDGMIYTLVPESKDEQLRWVIGIYFAMMEARQERMTTSQDWEEEEEEAEKANAEAPSSVSMSELRKVGSPMV